MICEGTPTYGWVCGWLSGCMGQWVGSGQITNYSINLDDLIGIIQFQYDLWRHPQLWVDVWMVRWMAG